MNTHSIAQAHSMGNDNDVVQIHDASAGSMWQEGFNAYMDGVAFEEMLTPQLRRGWWAALSAQAELDEYREDILDRQWWARGAW